MQIGSNLWKSLQETLDYGFRKLDEGTAYLSKTTFVAMSHMLQIGPGAPFSHRFSPQFHSAMLWIEKNPIVINRVVNLCKIAADMAQGKISEDTIAHLLQLSVNDKTDPKWNKLVTFINAIRVCRIATNQLLGMTNAAMVWNLIDIFSHVYNIRYNNVMIEAYNYNKGVEEYNKKIDEKDERVFESRSVQNG